MRIHHLNCISTCPLGGALMDGRTLGLRARLACHCLLIETDDSLVLIDTGFGTRDVLHPRPRLSQFFLTLLAPDLRIELTAIRQIERLGFDPRDVRDIVITHLDFDHAGGLDDFPHATVHMLGSERRVALAQKTVLDRMRYRPLQWQRTVPNWRAYGWDHGDRWFGFRAVRQLDGLPPEIALVPLVGHTFGHAGVAVRRETDWLLLAGDAYFWHEEMNVERPRCTPGLQFYQRMMEQDRSSRLANQRRLRELKRTHGREVQIVSSHDPVEFRRAAKRSLSDPAGPLQVGGRSRAAGADTRVAAPH